MAGTLRDLGINNPYRKYDIYYNLPEKQERWDSKRPVGLKHAKGSEVDVMVSKLFFINKEA